MQIQRFFRHLFFTDWQIRRAFSPQCLSAIEKAIQQAETLQGGEIRFAVEGSLNSLQLMSKQTTRERALEVFSQLHVWDTEHNQGVLIYVLLADRAVEIVADRGIDFKAGQETWNVICQTIQAHFLINDFEQGALKGISDIAQIISYHFPLQKNSVNQLSNSPVMLT